MLPSVGCLRVRGQDALQRLVLIVLRIRRGAVEQRTRLYVFGAHIGADCVIDSGTHTRSAPVREKLFQVDFAQRLW